MYQEVCFNRGTEAGGGELMWALAQPPSVILCLLRACAVKKQLPDTSLKEKTTIHPIFLSLQN